MITEIKRLLGLLPTLDPTTEDYLRVIKSIELLYLLKDRINIDVEPEETKTDLPKGFEEVHDSVPFEEPVAKPVVEPVVTAPVAEYTMESVRALLTEASQNGTQIQPIIAHFVPEGKPVKFSSIPKESYAELVEVLKNAR